MTKKCRYLSCAAILVACVGVAWGVVAMLPPQHGGTKAKFDRIEKGMTEAELTAIFGGPGWPSSATNPTTIAWGGNDGIASVTFDMNGRTKNLQWFPLEETMTDKLRRWLGMERQNAWQQCP